MDDCESLPHPKESKEKSGGGCGKCRSLVECLPSILQGLGSFPIAWRVRGRIMNKDGWGGATSLSHPEGNGRQSSVNSGPAWPT